MLIINNIIILTNRRYSISIVKKKLIKIHTKILFSGIIASTRSNIYKKISKKNINRPKELTKNVKKTFIPALILIKIYTVSIHTIGTLAKYTHMYNIKYNF